MCVVRSIVHSSHIDQEPPISGAKAKFAEDLAAATTSLHNINEFIQGSITTGRRFDPASTNKLTLELLSTMANASVIRSHHCKH